MTQRLSIDPDPAPAGGKAKVCYDFTGMSDPSVKVTIDWRPNSVPDDEVDLTPNNNCKEVPVPANASGGFLIEQHSEDLGFLVD